MLNRQLNRSPEHLEKVKYLEQQLASIKEERTELYRTQGTNAQKLVEMHESIKIHETKSRDAEQEYVPRDATRLSSVINRLSPCRIARLREANTMLVNRVKGLADTLKAKDDTIQLLQDEHAALQLEFTKTDERLKASQQDNASLVERWMKKMAEEAERMNDLNAK